MKTLTRPHGASIALGLVLLLFVVPASMFLIPNYRLFHMTAQESEAKRFLIAIYDAQRAVLDQTGAYSTKLSDLKVDTSSAKFYRFGLVSDSTGFAKYCANCKTAKDKFVAIAVGTIDVGTDVWTIDQDRKLVPILRGGN